MKQKTILIVALMLLVVLVLTACGGQKATPTEAPATAGAASGDPEAGQVLFAAQTLGDNPGCATCHSLKPDETLVGPSMAGIATDVAGDAEEEGISTEEMLKKMILDPNDELAGDFDADIMPQDWGEKLTPQQVNDIVAYLLTLK